MIPFSSAVSLSAESTSYLFVWWTIWPGAGSDRVWSNSGLSNSLMIVLRESLYCHLETGTGYSLPLTSEQIRLTEGLASTTRQE